MTEKNQADTTVAESPSPADTLQVQGAEITAAVKKLLHGGNVRKIAVKSNQDQSIIEIPVTAGVAVAIVAPVLVAVAAIAAAVKDCTIEVHRVDEAALIA
ncbi:DUF4342 domain-containing protein [Rhodococcus sp. 1163]|uniref:DUF4342 domain-containing protein n=1 Tax=Rhodococcus sp. 1163 TaxID=1905289 RepID=UPI001179CD8E|nr:DUF4342 domain-containing protein [Rhodococcus sp. 1163]